MKIGRRPLLALAAGGLMAAQPAPDNRPGDKPQDLPSEEVLEAIAAARKEGVELVGPTDTDPEPTPEAIVRGRFVGLGGAPWQVQIYTTIALSAGALEADRLLAWDNPRKRFYAIKKPWERDHVCGAVLIADGWALSAAHCFVDSKDELKPLASRRARLGDNNLSLASEMAIERVIVHGDYRRAGNKRHDIALIRLVADAATDAKTASRARPVAWRMYGGQPLADGERLRVTGWGVTGEREAGPGNRDVDGRVLRASVDLQYADLLMVPMTRCRAIASYKKTVGDAETPFDGVLCVAGDDTLQDSCQGDSGGPLTRDTLLVGLVSTGFGCGLERVPALYTKVSAYDDWIEAAMKGSKSGVVTRCVLKRRFFRSRLACDD